MRLKLTRDGVIWYVGVIVSAAGFAFSHFEHLSGLLARMLPFLSPAAFDVAKAWIEFVSFTGTALCAYLRMSPLKLSPDHEMAVLPSQTLKGLTSQPTKPFLVRQGADQPVPIDTAMLKRPTPPTDEGK